MNDEIFLTFDDVLIAPAYSDIESRQEVDTSVDFFGTKLEVPLISANMDFVTGAEMVNAMHDKGALGILHRFYENDDAYYAEICRVNLGNPLYVSIGVREPTKSLDFIKWLVYEHDVRLKGVCIDVAHGHHAKVAQMIELIKGNIDERISGLNVIAGNVATLEGTDFLRESGADGIKVGIGAGSVCTTRTVAGVGVPQWSAILECASIKLDHPELVIIADGGIRSSSDIAKALGAGADVVMVGNLLAGTDEAPGEIIEEWDKTTAGERRKYKRYRGQASFGSNGERYVKEGIEGMVRAKGPVAPIIQQLQAGLRSSMGYVGARNLEEFRDNAKFVTVSSHTLMESSTRVDSYE